jgi:chromosome segregation protein
VEREARHVSAASAHADLEQRKAAHAQASSQVREDEDALRDQRIKADSISETLSGVSLKERELSLEIEHLATQVQERYALAIVEAVHQYHALPPLSEAAQEKLKDLRAALEKMGEVNVTAIEEHQEIAQRFEFLSKQKKDLEASLAQLTGGDQDDRRDQPGALQGDLRHRQREVPAGVPRCSAVGAPAVADERARLPVRSRASRFSRSPRARSCRAVNLFSGGEKALTAVALIFAIFLIKPTPFCLLDEVDAPLDEGNVGRYNEMVREMSKTSQFILITHNKRTMEIVDTLYGVTMEEPGVSKLVSVKLREAVARNSDMQVA